MSKLFTSTYLKHFILHTLHRNGASILHFFIDNACFTFIHQYRSYTDRPSQEGVLICWKLVQIPTEYSSNKLLQDFKCHSSTSLAIRQLYKMMKLQKLQKVPLHQIDVNIKDNKSFEHQVRRWVKELVMEFSNSFEKAELTMILEYCEYNIRVAQNLLRNNTKGKVREKLKAFCDGTDTSEMIPMMEESHMSPTKLPGADQTAVQVEPEEEQEPGFPLFEKITPELLYYIFDLLDPFSLGKAACTCKFALSISRNPLLFKKFCLALYVYPQRLPDPSPFIETVDAINNAGYGEFTHNFIQRANENIRQFVWLNGEKSYHTNRNYYKQFKDFKSVYLEAPRLSYVGVYVMKGRYLRDGEKDLHGFYKPFHMVEYYRYMRFFPDGSVMHCLTVKKLKKDVIERIFTVKKIADDDFMDTMNKGGIKKDSVLKGEYLIKGEQLQIRLCGKKTVYEYKLTFLKTDPGFFYLRLEEYDLRNVERDVAQKLPMDQQGNKTFKFTRIPSFKDDLEESSLKYSTS